MPDRFAAVGCCHGRICEAAFAGMFGVAFERSADQVAGAEPNGESEREDDASEEYSKGQLDDMAADLEVIEGHGRGEHKHEPLDAERKKPRVVELRIDCSDEDRARQEPRRERSSDEQQGGANDAGEERQK